MGKKVGDEEIVLHQPEDVSECNNDKEIGRGVLVTKEVILARIPIHVLNVNWYLITLKKVASIVRQLSGRRAKDSFSEKLEDMVYSAD